jgi:signal recognition particle subunit SRP54
VHESEAKLKKFKIIMDSMTLEELQNPQIIKYSRILRIARGAGCKPEDVRALLKYYKTTQRAVRGFLGDRKLRRMLLKQLGMVSMET